MKAIMLLAILAVTSAYGSDAQSSFEAHNYAEAAAQMEQQVATSPPSAENFYNLGLAREKAGETLPAALNYERALLLNPGLRPARNALATLASAKSVPLPPHRWTDEVNAVVHPDALAWTGSILAWAGLSALVFGRHSRQRGMVVACAIFALLVGGTALTAAWLCDPRMTNAVPSLVTAKDGAEVLTAPASNSTPVVSLPQGTPVAVLSPRGAWTYIDVNGGARGWVQTERLTPLIPGATF